MYPTLHQTIEQKLSNCERIPSGLLPLSFSLPDLLVKVLAIADFLGPFPLTPQLLLVLLTSLMALVAALLF